MRNPVLIAEGLSQGCKMPGSEGLLLLPAVLKGKEGRRDDFSHQQGGIHPGWVILLLRVTSGTERDRLWWCLTLLCLLTA